MKLVKNHRIGEQVPSRNHSHMNLNGSNRISPAPSILLSENNEQPWDRDTSMPPQMMKRWFGGRPNGDLEITNLFKKDLVDVGHGNVRHWLNDRDGRLATIILCDQFSRNIYRGMAEAFSFDHISLKISKHLIGHKEEFRTYKNFEKLFIIMPLMHSESVEDCQLCIDILQKMIDEFQQSGHYDLARIFELNKKWGQEHYDILQQYGRYPHRNKVLGRENTDDEELYLRDANSFGQQHQTES